MILEQKSTVGLVNTGVLRSRRLGITSEGLSHIATILQDTLYTDKILAPVREYATNAMDSHIEAGIPNRPIKIKLPNRFSPTFCVRDYGIGMDEDRIWNVFCNYGESTKRSSNSQVGMLGIGSKSAFAYGKSFTIVSFLNGTRKSYVCHIGGSNEGEFVEMANESTTEENGLEIQIPVAVADIQSFIDRSAKFFAHWEVTPEFEGATLNIVKAERIFEGDGWYMAKDDQNGYGTKGVKLLMGNISYAVGSISTMKSAENGIADDESHVYRKLLESNLILKTSIGSVDIAANREALQMTDKTIKTLWTLLKNVRSEIGLELQKKFDVLPTMWDKRVLRGSFASYQSPLSQFSSFLPDHLSNLKTSFRLDSAEVDGIEVTTFSKGRRGRQQVRGTYRNPYSIEASDRNCVIINSDLTITGSHVRNHVTALIERADNIFKKTFSNVYVFHVKDVTKFNLWKAAHLFDFPLVNLSSLPDIKFSEFYPHLRKPSTRSLNADKNSKKFLILDMDCTGVANSDYFKPGIVPKNPVGRIPYIVIDSYHIAVSDGDIHPRDAITHLNNLSKEFKLKIPDNIVSVKKGSVERLAANPNFISLWEVLAKRLNTNKEFFNRMVTLELRVMFPSFEKKGNYNNHIHSGDISIDNRVFTSFEGEKSHFDSTKLFHKILVKYEETKQMTNLPMTASVVGKNSILETIIKSRTNFDERLAKQVNSASTEFKSLLGDFYKNYPMVKLIDSHNFGYSPKLAMVKEIGEYIKLVDGSTK